MRCEAVRNSRSVRTWFRLVLASMAVVLFCGCGAPPKFVFHAAKGQWELYRAARPISEAMNDRRMPARVRELLSEVPHIKAYALENGLAISDNYDEFVALNRPYVVWF